MITICGRSKAGKSRTLFEGLKEVREDGYEVQLIAPTTGDAARSLFESIPSGGDGRRPIVWLDDLETFVASGLTLEILRDWHERNGAMFVATYGGKGSEQLREQGEGRFGVLTDTMLQLSAQINLSTTSAAELKQLPSDIPLQAQREIEHHGLPAVMVAAPALERKLMTGRHAAGDHESRQGVAIVRAVIDWARCGRIDPIPLDVLRSLWRTYLPAASPPSDEQFDQAVEWALRPLSGTIALVQDIGGLFAFDYIVGFVEQQSDDSGPSAGAWRHALDTSDPTLALLVGVNAALSNRDEDAIEAMRTAATSQQRLIAGIASLNLGILLDRNGDLDGAEDAYQKAESLGEDRGTSNLGSLLNRCGDLDGAEKAFRRADERGNEGAANNLGVLLEQRGDLKNAEEAYRRADDRGSELGANNLGVLLEEQGDLDGAENAFERAAERGSPDGAYGLGELLLRRDDLEGAAEAFRRADGLGDAASACKVGELLMGEGDQRGAEDAFRRADERGDVDAAVHLGVILAVEGKLDAAKETLQRADEAGHPLGALYLAEIHLKNSEISLGEAALRRADERGSDRAAFQIGWALMELGHIDSAEDAFRRADARGSPDGALSRGALHEGRGEAQEATAAYRRAADRGDAEGASCLGMVLESLGDTEQAEAAFRQADEGGHAGGSFNLGVLLLKQDHIEEAKTVLERAEGRGAETATFVLGLMALERGDRKAAERAFRRCAKSDDPELAKRSTAALDDLGSVRPRARWSSRRAGRGRR
jgi:TPR repeat protein